AVRRSRRCDLSRRGPDSPRILDFKGRDVSTRDTTTRSTRPTGALARLARVCASHPWATFTAWLVVIATVAVSASLFGGRLTNDFTIPGSDAQKAVDLLEQTFPARSGDSAQIVFQAQGGMATKEAHQAVDAARAAASDIPGVVSVGDPYAGKGG